MVKCDFSIPFQGSADQMVKKAEKAIDEAGGTFAGDASSGSFSVGSPLGEIVGTYKVTGQAAGFAITKKPFIVSCSKIESKLREYVQGAAEAEM